MVGQCTRLPSLGLVGNSCFEKVERPTPIKWPSITCVESNSPPAGAVSIRLFPYGSQSVLNAVVRDTELTISPPLAEQSVQKGQSGNAPRQRMMGKQTMNTVNPVVADAVTKLNESRTEEVQREAVRLI